MSYDYYEDSVAEWIEDRTVFVGGIDDSDEDDLWEYFEMFGIVDSVDVAREPDGTPRCFGFVTYESYDSVEDCLDYDRFHELPNGCVVEAKACQLPNPIHQYHALYHRLQKAKEQWSCNPAQYSSSAQNSSSAQYLSVAPSSSSTTYSFSTPSAVAASLASAPSSFSTFVANMEKSLGNMTVSISFSSTVPAKKKKKSNAATMSASPAASGGPHSTAPLSVATTPPPASTTVISGDVANHSGPSASASGFIGTAGSVASSSESVIGTSDTVRVGERVVSIDDSGFKPGTVRWIGRLQEFGSRIVVGLELDEAVGSGTGQFGDEHLFTARANHAAFIPLASLMREKDFSGGGLSKSSVSADKRQSKDTRDDEECQVCFEKKVNSVFYTCGHTCLCYECAVDCRAAKPGLCPICRAPIRDVIKILSILATHDDPFKRGQALLPVKLDVGI